jgi:hypothetical protein
MRAFLQNCPQDYNDDIELNIDQLARKSMNQQVKTVASSRECVDGHAKLRTQEPSQPRGQPPATSPTRVSRVTWGPSQVVQIPQRIPPKDPTRMSEGSHKESTKD